MASPSPVHETPHKLPAYVPDPIRGESPILPIILFINPPVEVAAAHRPWLSTTTQPTVSGAYTLIGSPFILIGFSTTDAQDSNSDNYYLDIVAYENGVGFFGQFQHADVVLGDEVIVVNHLYTL
ncbi:ABC transporter [Striga asiatica]|uniref:ABC transporter n=1 Tax=Striga asiatica TaxID=4170 RepID=A0A5A7Q5H8_STRAF|nr:ABC transporter [Striga asiatica]